jgi:hypothetical protein
MSLTVGGKKKTKFRMLAGMPDTHSMAGMPNTRQLNGGWGADHPGNIENQNKTKSLLQKKRDSFIQDPQDKRNQGKMKIDETDNVPGFLKDKLSRNGSLSTAPTGLCLKGEEDGEKPSDGTFYGMKDGKRGWYKVAAESNESVKVREENVVVDVEYDPDTRKFLKRTKKVMVVDVGFSSKVVEGLVFVATPL